MICILNMNTYMITILNKYFIIFIFYLILYFIPILIKLQSRCFTFSNLIVYLFILAFN